MEAMGQTRTSAHDREYGGPLRAADLPLIAPVREWHRLFPVLSRDHLYQAIQTGQLTALHRGRRVLVSRAAFLDFIGEPPATPVDAIGVEAEEAAT